MKYDKKALAKLVKEKNNELNQIAEDIANAPKGRKGDEKIIMLSRFLLEQGKELEKLRRQLSTMEVVDELSNGLAYLLKQHANTLHPEALKFAELAITGQKEKLEELRTRLAEIESETN